MQQMWYRNVSRKQKFCSLNYIFGMIGELAISKNPVVNSFLKVKNPFVTPHILPFQPLGRAKQRGFKLQMM